MSNALRISDCFLNWLLDVAMLRVVTASSYAQKTELFTRLVLLVL